jgi:hypothetical protein
MRPRLSIKKIFDFNLKIIIIYSNLIFKKYLKMTTLTFDQQYKFKNTHFKNFKDFFDFAIDNQLI